MTALTLANVEAMIRGLAPAKRAALEEKLHPVLKKPWLPQPGPQTQAYYSEADETLYGGAAGGGKTALLQGLATTAHQRSLLFRSQSKDLDGLWDELVATVEAAGMKVSNDTVKRRLRMSDGRVIEGGHLEKPGSEKAWQGRPHDFIGFDEAAQLDELKVEFVIRWLRSTIEGQRKRVVFATNPPIPEIKNGVMVDTGVGDWLIRWFAPWLDDMFPRPAQPGELRWCYMIAEGDRLTTQWVDGPGLYDLSTGELDPDADESDIDSGRCAAARSRTFIKSLLKDNVFLKGTGYAERLSGTPEPLRSMLLLGDFTVKGEDHPFQVIPTAWVLAAQKRWLEREQDPDHKFAKMLVLFCDVAQGGLDTTIAAPLFTDNYYGMLKSQPGSATPTGKEVGMHIIANRLDNALVGLDGTGGWAGGATMWLQAHHQIEAELVVSSHKSMSWNKTQTYKFANVRAEMWWAFREALDPETGEDIALPPDTRLRAQLVSPHWIPRGKEILIESKDDLRVRLGSSTDEADCVIGAWHLRLLALSRPEFMRRNLDIIEVLNGRQDPHTGRHKVEDTYDPLAGW